MMNSILVLVLMKFTLSVYAQESARKHDGCEAHQLQTGVLLSCVRSGLVTTAEIKNGEQGTEGAKGDKGKQGDTGSRGSPGDGLPNDNISWCHHNYDSDHADVQHYIPLSEFILGGHMAYPHGFDYRGECVGGCSCDICQMNNPNFLDISDPDNIRVH